MFEMQYHTAQSLEIKEINHKLYEEQRLSDTTEERKRELAMVMKENSKKVIHPIDSERIKNK